MDAAAKNARITEITAELNKLYPEIYRFGQEIKGLRKKADQPRKEELKAKKAELEARRDAIDSEREQLEAEIEAAREKSPRELAIEAIEGYGFEIGAGRGTWLWLNKKRELTDGAIEFRQDGTLNIYGLSGKAKATVRRAVEGIIEVVEIEMAPSRFGAEVDPSTLDDPMDRLEAEARRAERMHESEG